jgi:acyl CoA:acetate/3-ketoacid CoA transferase
LSVETSIFHTSTEDEDLRSLYEWLAADDGLRGSRISMADQRPAAEDMGALSDSVMVALSGGGAVTAAALIRAVENWLTQRRTPVRLSIRSGKHVTDVDIGRVRDPRIAAELVNAIISGSAGSEKN